MPGLYDVLAGIWGRWGYRLEIVRNQNRNGDTPQDKEQQNGDTLLNFGTAFTFESLKKATKNFSNRLRDGAFSSCFKGTLENRTVVAVKVLNESYKRDLEFDFFSLLRTMSRISHRNVVEFIGYCIEDDHRMIVYEFVGDYDLDQLLSNTERKHLSVLSWPRRASICLGVARGVEYLHQGISPGVIHRGIQTNNVLLDKNFNPKIMDFEIAHQIDDALSGGMERIVGTRGYAAPEYVSLGIVTEKVDVYNFGVLILEVITGRKHRGSPDKNSDLVNWVGGLRESGRVMEIVDPRLPDAREEEVVRFINTALSCVQGSSKHRPSMFEVLLMLSGGYDFSLKVLINPKTQPAIVYDLMDRPAHVNRR